MPKIFISHAWEDNEISRKLVGQLRRDGAEIWIYYTHIEIGNRLPEFIRKAIEWCDIFVLLWSKSATNSFCVNLEWQHALNLKKRIILCLLDDAKQSASFNGLLYVNFSNFEQGYDNLTHLLNLNITDDKEQEDIPDENENIIKPILTPIKFREEPRKLSDDDVSTMIEKYNFFDLKRNENGLGIEKQLEIQEVKDEKLIIDQLSGLMWQQAGSLESMWYKEAKSWIEDINRNSYAGYNDWRLPTLEEAMSLMKNEKGNDGLYIDTLFDSKQLWIWTSDLSDNASRVWVVFFNYGSCYVNCFDFNNFVRAVRSEK
jgi:hypothetical protein